MKNTRDSMVFYRSFYEAIKELNNEQQGIIYNAIFSYSLDFIEPELTGICKTIWTLIKPQLDANIKKYKNGLKPKQKQSTIKIEAKQKQNRSKVQANVNDNVNDNVNEKVNVNDKKVYRAFAHLSLSVREFEDLEKEYPKSDIDDILDEIENYANNKNYKSLKLTAKKWLKKRYDEKVSKNLNNKPFNLVRAVL